MQNDNLNNIRHKWPELSKTTKEHVQLRHKELMNNWVVRIVMLGLNRKTFAKKMKEESKEVEGRISRQWLISLINGKENPTNHSVLTVEKHLHDLEDIQDKNESA